MSDRLRHGPSGPLWEPVYWSPLQEVDLATVPVEPQNHELVIYLAELARPDPGKLFEYIDKNYSLYAPTLAGDDPQDWRPRMTALMQPAFGAGGSWSEILLCQRIVENEGITQFISNYPPKAMYDEGTWYTYAKHNLRDERSSRYIQSAPLVAARVAIVAKDDERVPRL